MLSLNFHKTFIPERGLIAEILEYAAKGKKGNYQGISTETGIPMGKSSGKVPAILAYASGMGLIEVFAEKGVKKPVLTPFGNIVYKKDKYLSENVVQWLAHMNLCRNDIGAKVWHAVFAMGRNIIGSAFTREQLEEYLISLFGKCSRIIGPLVSAYQKDVGFKEGNILFQNGSEIFRNKAPISELYSLPYSAHILTLLEAYFKNANQVTLTDFNNSTLWFETCLWTQSDIELAFSYIERKGYVSIDRKMHPWIIEKRADASNVWPHIWDEIV